MINPWAIVGGLLLLIAVAFGGMHTGRKLERATWQDKELATAKASQKALTDAIQSAQKTQLLNEANARKATQDHEKAINDINKKYATAQSAGRLRIDSAVCSSVTASDQSTSARRPHEASSGTVELPQSVAEHLYAEARRADELAEQLRGLQGWIISAGYYGEAP